MKIEGYRQVGRKIYLTLDEVEKLHSEWALTPECQEKGITAPMMLERIRKLGYTVKDALTIPNKNLREKKQRPQKQQEDKPTHCMLTDAQWHAGIAKMKEWL